MPSAVMARYRASCGALMPPARWSGSNPAPSALLLSLVFVRRRQEDRQRWLQGGPQRITVITTAGAAPPRRSRHHRCRRLRRFRHRTRGAETLRHAPLASWRDHALAVPEVGVTPGDHGAVVWAPRTAASVEYTWVTPVSWPSLRCCHRRRWSPQVTTVPSLLTAAGIPQLEYLGGSGQPETARCRCCHPKVGSPQATGASLLTAMNAGPEYTWATRSAGASPLSPQVGSPQVIRCRRS